MSERRLIWFIEDAWSIVEPKRQFVNGWAIGAVAEHLEAITLGHIDDLLINVPPGLMKSLSTDVFWPAWEWGPMNRPSLRHIAFSYNPALTIRDNRKCRMIINSDMYRERWGDRFTLVDDQNAKIKFENDKTGWCYASSVGGIGTGERGDRTKVDDPHNVQDGESEVQLNKTVTWFRETLSTRVNDMDTTASQHKSNFVVIMQRVNENDVSGCIVAEEFGYTHLMLPMRFDGERGCKTIYLPNSFLCKHLKETTGEEIPWTDPRDPSLDLDKLNDMLLSVPERGEGALLFPERFSEEAVAKLEKRLGEYAAAAQLDQRPSPRAGGLIKTDKITIVDAAPPCVWVRGWDLAGTKKTGNVSQRQAATASVLMGMNAAGQLYIGHAMEVFESASKVPHIIKGRVTQDGEAVWQSIPQDPGQAGKHQVVTFAQQLHGFKVEFTPESGDKVTRMLPFAGQVDAQNVFLVKGDWNVAYLAQMGLFPNGRKDMADATSRAYAKLVSLLGQKQTLGAAMTAHEDISNMSSAPHLSGAVSGAGGARGVGIGASPSIQHLDGIPRTVNLGSALVGGL